MKNKLSFNTNIFIEAMRQLRVTGIIGVIIMAGLAIIRIVAMIADYTDDAPIIQTTFTGIGWMPWMVISFMLITPLLMFQAFHFMDKRNSSDLYHSLPHTRGTIFISVSAAVMAWVIISIIATVIPSLLSALFFSKYIAFIYDTFFLFILTNIVSCLLVGGAILIAKSLSGTIFNGIILTGLIIFVPRFLMTMFISAIESNNIFRGFIGNSFTRNELNPVVSSVFAMLGIDTSADLSLTFINVSTIIYGFILGIIYFILGGFAFCRRNSETASQSAPSRRIQALYRIIIALVLSSAIVVAIFEETLYDYGIDVLEFVILYLLVAFVYFLYELITTKKLKNLVRAIPGLGIVAVFNIAMFFGISGFYKNAMSFRPAPDEINSVTVIPDIDANSNYNSISYYDYVLNKIDGLEITDKKIIEDVSYTLDKNLSMTESSVSRLYNSYSSSAYLTSFQINTNGTSKCRNIFLNDEQYTNLNKVVCNSKTFKDAWMSLPALKDINDVYAYDNNTNRHITSEENAEELYTMLANEIKTADFETWFNAYIEKEVSNINFTCRYLINGKTYYLTIPVFEEVVPETAKKCNEIVKEKQLKELKDFKEYLSKVEKSGASFNGDIYVYIFNANSDGETISRDFSFSNSLDLVYEILDACPDDYLDDSYVNQKHMEVSFHFYDVGDPGLIGYGYSFTFPVDEKTISKISNMQASGDAVVYDYE